MIVSKQTKYLQAAAIATLALAFAPIAKATTYTIQRIGFVGYPVYRIGRKQ